MADEAVDVFVGGGEIGALTIRSKIQHRSAGVLVLGISAWPDFDDLYRGFCDLVTTQVATAIGNARAYEEERKDGVVEQIFQPFGRAPNALAAKIPGLGLGLSICRQIAQQHGGSPRAESDGEGRGTTMVLRLPPARGIMAARPL